MSAILISIKAVCWNFCWICNQSLPASMSSRHGLHLPAPCMSPYHSSDQNGMVRCRVAKSSWPFPKQSLKVKISPKMRKFYIWKIAANVHEVCNIQDNNWYNSEPSQPRCYSLVSLNNRRVFLVGSCALLKVCKSRQNVKYNNILSKMLPISLGGCAICVSVPGFFSKVRLMQF